MANNGYVDESGVEYSNINYRITYPDNPKFNYTSQLVRLNLDEEREKSIMSGNGFLITQVQSSLRKDLKSPTGIYSPKFGQTLQDMHPFIDNYRCLCGDMKGRFDAGRLCEKCGTLVEFKSERFDFFGWLVLNDFYTIHPNLYKALVSYIGKKPFDNIIKPVDEKDENGFSISIVPPKGEPFFGIGIMGLKERLKEVLDYYNKTPKREKYKDLMLNFDKIFTQSLPVNLNAASL